MLGETYDRFIAGEAVKAKTSPLYLPDDKQFHGIGSRAQYKMDSYWDTNHVRPLRRPPPAVDHGPHRHIKGVNLQEIGLSKYWKGNALLAPEEG
jgi:hypothetical protein